MGLNMSQAMGSVIDLFSVNTTVTLIRVTDTADKFGDLSSSTTSETITASVNEITGEEDWNKYGVFVPGDKLFFIKSSVTAPTNGDKITYRGTNYKIMRVNSHDTGAISHYECYTKKV